MRRNWLARSTSDEVQDENDSLWLYLGAGLGCAVSNYIGNKGMHLIAIPLLAVEQFIKIGKVIRVDALLCFLDGDGRTRR